MKRTLNIVPHGIIKRGHISYEVTEHGSVVNFEGEITARMGLFSRTIPINGSHHGLFLNSNYSRVGQEVAENGFVARVLDVDASLKMAHVQITYPKLQLSGVVTVDLSEGDIAPIKIASAHVDGIVNGIHVSVELAAAAQMRAL